MKITPDSSLFTALSNFPDPAQVRDAAVRRQGQRNDGVNDAGKRSRDARDAVRQEVARRQQAVAKGADGQKKAVQVRANTTVNQAPGRGEANAFRREVPNTEARPKFVRLGQFVDITV